MRNSYSLQLKTDLEAAYPPSSPDVEQWMCVYGSNILH